MKPIKVLQKEKGRIANIDKSYIIEQVRKLISDQKRIFQFKHIIDNRFMKVKYALLTREGMNAFERYLEFNTNISTDEILGLEKENSEEKMYNHFKDMSNKKM